MNLWLYQLASTLTFRDVQKSVHSRFSGATPDTFPRNALLATIAAVALLVLILHLRQRQKANGPPNNIHKLARELSRGIPFPPGSRILLYWVSRSTHIPIAALLISSETFDAGVESWSNQPTFTIAREWGRHRLRKLKNILFDDHLPPAIDRANPNNVSST